MLIVHRAPFLASTVPRATSLLPLAGLSAVAAGTLLALVPLLFGSPQPRVHIYWRNVNDAERHRFERDLHLTEADRRNDGAWAYVPSDLSVPALRAIVTHPAVADTNGINRRTFHIGQSPPMTPRRGGVITGAPPWLPRAFKLAGYAVGALALCLLGGAGLVSSPGMRATSAAARALGAAATTPSQAIGSTGAILRWLASTAGATMTPTSAAAALFVVALAWRFLTFSGFSDDHYAHVALAQQMLLGDRPIRDFSDPGWPLMYLLSAAAWVLTNGSMAGEWAIVAAGFALGAAWTVLAAYRLSGSLVIAIVVTATEILIYPRSYSYPKVAAYAAAAVAMIAIASNPSRRRIVATAALIAIAFLLRHDHGLFIGTGVTLCLLLASRRDGWAAGAHRVITLMFSVLAFLLPWILFVMVNGGLIPYFQGGIEYSRGESNATRLTSLPLFVRPYTFTPMANAEAWMFWLYWSLPAACGIVAYRRARRGALRIAGEVPVVAGLILIAVLVDGSFLRQALYVRLPDAIVPAVLLGAWLLGVCWMEPWQRRGAQRALQVATLVILAVSVAAAGRISDVRGQYADSDLGRGAAAIGDHALEVAHLLTGPHRQPAAPPSRYAQALMPFFSYLDRCSQPTDRVIVTGEFPDIPVLAGRRFASDGVVFGTWYSSIVHQAQTVERLKARAALFALHMGDYDAFRTRFWQVERYLADQYQPFATVAVDDGSSIRVVVFRGRIPVGTDAQTGWPCYR